MSTPIFSPQGIRIDFKVSPFGEILLEESAAVPPESAHEMHPAGEDDIDFHPHIYTWDENEHIDGPLHDPLFSEDTWKLDGIYLIPGYKADTRDEDQGYEVSVRTILPRMDNKKYPPADVIEVIPPQWPVLGNVPKDLIAFVPTLKLILHHPDQDVAAEYLLNQNGLKDKGWKIKDAGRNFTTAATKEDLVKRYLALVTSPDDYLNAIAQEAEELAYSHTGYYTLRMVRHLAQRMSAAAFSNPDTAQGMWDYWKRVRQTSSYIRNHAHDGNADDQIIEIPHQVDILTALAEAFPRDALAYTTRQGNSSPLGDNKKQFDFDVHVVGNIALPTPHTVDETGAFIFRAPAPQDSAQPSQSPPEHVSPITTNASAQEPTAQQDTMETLAPQTDTPDQHQAPMETPALPPFTAHRHQNFGRRPVQQDSVRLHTEGMISNAIWKDPVRFFKDNFADVANLLADRQLDGTTVTSVLVGPEHIACANAGDSPAFMAIVDGNKVKKIEILHHEHSGKIPSEVKRIKREGGVLFHDRLMEQPKPEDRGPSRIAVTRSFGDHGYKALSAKPDIRVLPFPELTGSERLMIVLGSDGLTQALPLLDGTRASKDKLCAKMTKLIEEGLESGQPDLAKFLTYKALPRGSDNISAVVLEFNKAPKDTVGATVCDGHGEGGASASKIAAEGLATHFIVRSMQLQNQLEAQQQARQALTRNILLAVRQVGANIAGSVLIGALAPIAGGVFLAKQALAKTKAALAQRAVAGNPTTNPERAKPDIRERFQQAKNLITAPAAKLAGATKTGLTNAAAALKAPVRHAQKFVNDYRATAKEDRKAYLTSRFREAGSEMAKRAPQFLGGMVAGAAVRGGLGLAITSSSTLAATAASSMIFVGAAAIVTGMAAGGATRVARDWIGKRKESEGYGWKDALSSFKTGCAWGAVGGMAGFALAHAFSGLVPHDQPPAAPAATPVVTVQAPIAAPAPTPVVSAAPTPTVVDIAPPTPVAPADVAAPVLPVPPTATVNYSDLKELAETKTDARLTKLLGQLGDPSDLSQAAQNVKILNRIADRASELGYKDISKEAWLDSGHTAVTHNVATRSARLGAANALYHTVWNDKCTDAQALYDKANGAAGNYAEKLKAYMQANPKANKCNLNFG